MNSGWPTLQLEFNHFATLKQCCEATGKIWVFLFIYLGFFVPVENFSLIWRRHHYRWRAANVDVYSVFMAIEQWGFFSMPHLMWHGPTLYSCHLRGPMTLTSVAERLAVELSLPVFRTQICRYRGCNPDIHHTRQSRHRGGK